MGTFLLVNINYILSFAYIDAIVHCNVPDVWNSALWACFCLRGANGPHIARITEPIEMEKCEILEGTWMISSSNVLSDEYPMFWESNGGETILDD